MFFGTLSSSNNSPIVPDIFWQEVLGASIPVKHVVTVRVLFLSKETNWSGVKNQVELLDSSFGDLTKCL